MASRSSFQEEETTKVRLGQHRESSRCNREEPSDGSCQEEACESELAVERVLDSCDLAGEILLRLDIPTLCRGASVSRKWRKVFGNDYVWLLKLQELVGPKLPLQLPPGKQNASSWKLLYKAVKELGTTWKFPLQLPLEGIACSSEREQYSMDWTLSNDLFWSSEVFSEPAADEFLTYRLSYPLSIVTGVEVVPALFWGGCIPKTMQVEVGFGERNMHFKSAAMAMEDGPISHYLQFPRPCLVVGDTVRIRFKGMHPPMRSRQVEAEEGFGFFCIQRVRIMGVPVGAVGNSLLENALVAHSLQHPSFVATTSRLLRLYLGEKLELEAVVSLLRSVLAAMAA